MSLSTTQLIKERTIDYPTSDGHPMAENTLQFQWIVTIKEGLEALLRHTPAVFVAGDLLWYPVQGNNRLRRAPDAMVAFGRPKGYRGAYLQWEEDDIPPQVVFEVLSPGNTAREMQDKFKFYDQYGVEEYYVYDPHSHQLNGWQRQKGQLTAIEPMTGWVSPRLGIRFEVTPDDGLTIYDPDGQPFLTYVELAVDRDQAQRRALQERQRAEQAEYRAQQLAAKLRAMGIDPDST